MEQESNTNSGTPSQTVPPISNLSEETAALKHRQEPAKIPPPPPVPPITPPEPPNDAKNRKKALLPFLLIAVALLIILIGVAVFLFQKNKKLPAEGGNNSEVAVPPVAEPPTTTPKNPNAQTEKPTIKSDAVLIQEAMAKKHNKNVGDVRLGVKEATSEYATGSVTFSGESGGGWWLAAKTADGWVIVADGNGAIMCADVKPYSFPKSMVSECYDGDTGSLKQL